MDIQVAPVVPALAPPTAARDRILATAYELFSQRGIRAVGVDELIRTSGVAKATFYRYFPSKDALVLAFLGRREEVWSQTLMAGEAQRRAEQPDEQLIVLFDILGEWFERDTFEACSFAKVLLEMGPRHRLGQASIACVLRIRSYLESLAEAAALRDPSEVAAALLTLMQGSILSAVEGDTKAAARSKQLARWLIDHHRTAA